jgi:hypothetical protein
VFVFFSLWKYIFPIFQVVLLRVCFSSILLDLAEGTFHSVEITRLVLIWLPRLLSRYLGTPKIVIFEGFWSISFRIVCVLAFFVLFLSDNGHHRAQEVSDGHGFLFAF